MNAIIRKCSCQHEAQDEIYGPGLRSHNRCRNGWKCTVCDKLVDDPQHMNIGDVDFFTSVYPRTRKKE